MKKTNYILIIFCSTLIFLLCVFSWLAPYTMEHGYYVTVAKMMADGMIPWRDFNLMDSPLGVFLLSLPYILIEKTLSGAIAVALTILMHILNLYLLFRLLKIYQVSLAISTAGACAYIVCLCASYGFCTTLEPFAVCFLLSSMYLLTTNYSYKIWRIGFLLSCAVLCKIQVLVLFPAIATYAAMRSSRDYILKITYVTGLFLTLSYVLVSLMARNWGWVLSLDFSIHTAPQNMNSLIYCVLLFLLRIYAFTLLPLFYYFKEITIESRKTVISALLAVCGIIILATVGYDKSWPQLCVPFIILCVCTTYVDMIKKHKWASLFLSFLIVPICMAGWEIKKIEMGDRKINQKHLLEVISLRTHEMTDTIHVIAFHSTEYDLGPQVFSELNKIPFNLSKTRYGFTKWDNPMDTFDKVDQASIVMAPERVFYGFNNLEEQKQSNDWEKTFNELFKKRVLWVIDEDLMFLTKDKPFYTQEEIEEDAREYEEHEHGHEHKHAHHHMHEIE